MSDDFTEIAVRLRYWFAKHDIQTKSVTLIINIAEANPAAAFDTAFREEFAAYRLNPGIAIYSPVDVRRGFELHGLKFRLESPIHEEPGQVVIRRFVKP